MRSISKAACLVAAGAAAGVLLSLAAPASGLDTPGTIKITDRLVEHIHVHGPSKQTNAGSLDFYRQQLYNKGITPMPIGHSDLTCVNTGTGSSNCTGTYFLPEGKIMVGGVIASRLFYQVAVVGGTGVYDNVNGTLTVTYLGGRPSQEFLIFRLGL
jgi:hypothetical protein